MNTPTDQPPQSSGGYHVEMREVTSRLGAIEGQMKSFATKADVASVQTEVAKAQLQMLKWGIGILITVVVVALGVAVRFWLASGGGVTP